MKEIKFRAWDYETRVMLSWITLYPRIHELYGQDKDDSATSLEFLQFTGLYDKNGKEIYEGDIVEIIDKPLTIYAGDTIEIIDKPFTGDYNTIKYQVIWSNSLGGFFPETLSKERIDLLMGYVAPASEIIGNIYENPELLNK